MKFVFGFSARVVIDMFYLAVLSASEHPVNIREIKTLIINFYSLISVCQISDNWELVVSFSKLNDVLLICRVAGGRRPTRPIHSLRE